MSGEDDLQLFAGTRALFIVYINVLIYLLQKYRDSE